MSDDYRVQKRSNSECRELAKKAREFFSVSNARHVDVLGCLSSKRIWTVKGIRHLNFQIRPDSEMGAKEGVTSYGKDVVSIAIKQSVHDRARMGIGRDRLTCAHELGHGVMHEGPPLFRLVTGNKTPAWIEPYRSAEHQAKIFAPAFLINDDIASTLITAEEISIGFGVSLECATIYLEELTERRNRLQTAEKIKRFVEDFRTSAQPATFKVRYLQEVCTICHNQTIFPVGQKFMCQTCNTVFDRFQDGD